MNFGGLMVRMVDKKNPYKNVERLKEKLREHGCVFMKTEECFDLPDQTFITVDVPVTKEYKKFMKDCIITVEGEELVGDTSLTKRLHARQLCGMYNKEKLQAFKSLVESTNDRLIVFYTYTKELEKMLEVVERPVSIVNGQTKDLTAYEEHDDSITFVQYQAGAKGLNLQLSNKIIYFTLTDSVENWMQSAKRINRIGQTKPCFYYILQCKDSVEEVIYKALERGENFTDELFKQYEQETRKN
jgi:SNF2 family DNA or RNA helicase